MGVGATIRELGRRGPARRRATAGPVFFVYVAPDLVGEIRSAARKRKARRAMLSMVGLVFLVLLAIAAWFAVGWYRVNHALETAAERLDTDDRAELTKALDAIETARGIAPDNVRVLGARALVLAQAAAAWGADPEIARTAVDAATGTPEAALATVLLALHEGPLPEATAAADALAKLGAEPMVAGHIPWIRGLVALGHPHDGTRLAEALADLDAQLETTPDAVLYARTAAALQLRAGAHADALARVKTLREAAPTNLGLVVDEALIHAMTGQDMGGVVSRTDEIANNEDLAPRDRARARLARATARIHGGAADEGRTDLQTAWDSLPAWDWDARDRAVAQLRWLSDGETLSKWLADADPPQPLASLYTATRQLLSGDAPAALGGLAKEPQDHPEVAYLQALALVEQRRFEEAGPWIARGLAAFPDRLELVVAQARVAVRGADETARTAAVKTLDDLSRSHPTTPRVWTGLGEARTAAKAEPASIEAAFHKARKIESKPAEACYQLGRVERVAAKKNFARSAEAVELLGKAVEYNPHIPQYAQAYGEYLAHVGRDAEAREILTRILDLPFITAEVPFQLIRMELFSNPKIGKNRRKEILAWVTRAEELGGDGLSLAVERARVKLATGNASGARALLEPLVPQYPAHVDARIIYVRSLAATVGSEVAIENVKAGIRRTGRPRNGRLYLLWGELEKARGGLRQQMMAATRAMDGWERVLNDELPAREVFEAARFTMALWQQVKRDSIARRVGYQLTRRIPLYPEAYRYRAQLERRTDHLDKACELSRLAVLLPNAGANVWAERAACFSALGKVDDAKNAYDEAITRASKREKKEYTRARAKL